MIHSIEWKSLKCPKSVCLRIRVISRSVQLTQNKFFKCFNNKNSLSLDRVIYVCDSFSFFDFFALYTKTIFATKKNGVMKYYSIQKFIFCLKYCRFIENFIVTRTYWLYCIDVAFIYSDVKKNIHIQFSRSLSRAFFQRNLCSFFFTTTKI